jgi:hypothetical protein
LGRFWAALVLACAYFVSHWGRICFFDSAEKPLPPIARSALTGGLFS